MSLECDTDKQDQNLMALLICGARAAESTKVSFAPWNLFVGMGTSENQHRPTSNVVDHYVESYQHQWSRDRCRTHLCTLDTRADNELVISCAIISFGILVSDHVRSILEVVWHIVRSLSKSYICLCKIATSKLPRRHTTRPCTTLQEGGCYKTATLVLSSVECACTRWCFSSNSLPQVCYGILWQSIIHLSLLLNCMEFQFFKFTQHW